MKTAKPSVKKVVTGSYNDISPEFVQAKINEIIGDYCQKQIANSKNYPVSLELWQSLQRVVLAGGKRLRPYLIALACEACGGKPSLATMQVAAGWEMLHQSLLVHDDIIDRDYIRHGKLNVAGEYQQIYAKRGGNEPNVSHYANSAALLAGDLALSSAYQLALRADLDATQQQGVLEVMNDAINAVAGGELQDTDSVLDPIGSTDSLKIAELKTASYSFVAPLQTGAVLAGAPTSTTKLLADLGIATGIAFQLKDDLLGLFGDIENTGKSNDGDVKEGKRTLLVQYAFEAATPEQQNFIKEIVGNPDATSEQVQTFRELVVQTGAKKRVEDLVANYAEQAQKIVTSIPDVDERFLAKWDQLNQFILKRQS